MKKLILLLILSFFSAHSFAGSCPDGSEPTRSVSSDGSYYVYTCGGQSSSSSSSNISTNAFECWEKEDYKCAILEWTKLAKKGNAMPNTI